MDLAVSEEVCMRTISALGVGTVILLLAGCAQQPNIPPAAPPHAAAHAQPPDWFHQQVSAARAARRAYQPKTDTIGAQLAYDNVLRTACTRAALEKSGKYPARCDEVLHPTPGQSSPVDPCKGNSNDPAMQTECSD